MSGVLNDLETSIVPSVFESLRAVGLVDTMTIKRDPAVTQDTGGGVVKGTVTNAYTSVPCAIEPVERERTSRQVVGDQMKPAGRYTVTFPTHTSGGTRIAVNAKTDRFVVDTRTGHPDARTFRMLGVPRDTGVNYEADCVFEP